MSSVRDFGAVGDGRADDTRAIQHALNDGDGAVEFPRGEYRLTAPLSVDLEAVGRTSLCGLGGVAKLVMHAAGPAIVLRGTHTKTADPGGFRPEQWRRERMPMVRDLEIEGRHRQADGIRIDGVMQPTLTGLLIREVQTAVHVTGRARNLLVNQCHFYHNTGVGLHLDRVNLHQAIVAASHISYCRLGGIRIDASEVRNLQITGNDIEYNNNRSHDVRDAADVPTAEIFINVADGTVREGTIAGNTIQSTHSPGGANIRFVGRSPQENHKAGMWTIAGNLIGSQEVNVHLTSARGITLTGNYIYGGLRRNLLVESSRNIVVGGNCFGHNPDYDRRDHCTGIRFVDCQECNLSGVLIQDWQTEDRRLAHAPLPQRKGLIELVRCRRMNLSGTQVLDGSPYGLYIENCSDTLVTGCTILDGREAKLMQAAVVCEGQEAGNMIGSSRIGAGTEGTLIADARVSLSENLYDD